MDCSSSGGSQYDQALAPPVCLLWSVEIWPTKASSLHEGEPLILILLFGVFIININKNESQHSRDLFVCKRWAPNNFPELASHPSDFIEWSPFIYSTESLRFNWKVTECVASMVLMTFFFLNAFENM